jgi:hypothetical protein
MIAVAISSEANIAKLDENRARLTKLGDPRTVNMDDAQAAKLVDATTPIYYITGALHSGETGAPTALMELAYRLAVDESDYYKAIRKNVITFITPLFEVDGRDHMVDSYQQARALKLGTQTGGLPYWGKYVAHDNNRDGMVATQLLTKNNLKMILDWHPTVTHDLHESVPFLYVSTGTGPYNEEYDPIGIDEWHTLAYQDITELTRRGLPGVWTHSFFDGWAPNYQLSITQFHNSTGSFY